MPVLVAVADNTNEDARDIFGVDAFSNSIFGWGSWWCPAGIALDISGVPSGATIGSAIIYVRFQDNTNWGTVTVYGEDADSGQKFSSALSALTKTTASVNWTWSTHGTADYVALAAVTSIVQEIVNRAGWGDGVLTFQIGDEDQGSGITQCYDYSDSPSFAPKIVIKYLTDDQYARPDADNANPGSWTDEGTVDNDGNLYTSLDETYPDDGDSYVLSGNNPGSADYFEVGLPNLTDPASSSGHVIRCQAMRTAGSRDISLSIDLYEGATLRASLNTGNLSSTVWGYFEYELSGAEADAISDYTALALRVVPTTSGGGGPSQAQVNWLEFSVPPAGAGTEEVNLSLVRTAAITPAGGATAEGAQTLAINRAVAQGGGAQAEASQTLSLSKAAILAATKVLEASQTLTKFLGVSEAADATGEGDLTLNNIRAMAESADAQAEANQTLAKFLATNQVANAEAEANYTLTLVKTIVQTGGLLAEGDLSLDRVLGVALAGEAIGAGNVVLSALKAISQGAEAQAEGRLTLNSTRIVTHGADAQAEAGQILSIIKQIALAGGQLSEADFSLVRLLGDIEMGQMITDQNFSLSRNAGLFLINEAFIEAILNLAELLALQHQAETIGDVEVSLPLQRNMLANFIGEATAGAIIVLTRNAGTQIELGSIELAFVVGTVVGPNGIGSIRGPIEIGLIIGPNDNGIIGD